MQNGPEKNAMTRETVKALALANGLHLPDERLDRVLEQYQKYLELLARLDSFALAREAEPETIFTLIPGAMPER